MKIAINKCYGGFGLSTQAVIDLYNKKCPHVEEIELEKWGMSKDITLEKAQDKIKHYSSMAALKKKDKVIVLHDEHTDNRTCTLLIETIEELGSQKASSGLANLKIVEIPNDVDYEIDEYDGIESIHEKHRSW